jgi:hypothetical protein
VRHIQCGVISSTQRRAVTNASCTTIEQLHTSGEWQMSGGSRRLERKNCSLPIGVTRAVSSHQLQMLREQDSLSAIHLVVLGPVRKRASQPPGKHRSAEGKDGNCKLVYFTKALASKHKVEPLDCPVQREMLQRRKDVQMFEKFEGIVRIWQVRGVMT